MTDKIKTISKGELLFQGSPNAEIRELCIGKPLTNQILSQIVSFCVELPKDHCYLLSWTIKEGGLTGHECDEKCGELYR